jgi:hypothetical protein
LLNVDEPDGAILVTVAASDKKAGVARLNSGGLRRDTDSLMTFCLFFLNSISTWQEVIVSSWRVSILESREIPASLRAR